MRPRGRARGEGDKIAAGAGARVGLVIAAHYTHSASIIQRAPARLQSRAAILPYSPRASASTGVLFLSRPLIFDLCSARAAPALFCTADAKVASYKCFLPARARARDISIAVARILGSAAKLQLLLSGLTVGFCLQGNFVR